MPGTVYIIGAGASKADTLKMKLPFPLATEFFRTEYLLNWPQNDVGTTKFIDSALYQVLVQYFSFKYNSKTREVIRGSNINVEEVYSFLHTSENLYSYQLRYSELFIKAKRELTKYIVELISCLEVKPQPKLHSKILNRINPGDSIISFNWDLMFERLMDGKKKYRPLLDTQEELINPSLTTNKTVKNYENLALKNLHKSYFLKLHGSINFGRCKNNQCVHHQIPFVFSINEEIIDQWPCVSCGSSIEYMIVPPHVHKSYQNNRFLSLQANIAATKLSIAEEIVIIGYSLPIFDFDASVIFRIAKNEPWSADEGSECFLDRITVVNPDVNKPSYIKRITDIFGLESDKRSYGHKVKLSKFESVDEYLKTI